MTSLIPHHGPWSGLASENPAAEIGVLGVPFDNAVSWRGGLRSFLEEELAFHATSPKTP